MTQFILFVAAAGLIAYFISRLILSALERHNGRFNAGESRKTLIASIVAILAAAVTAGILNRFFPQSRR
jgi:branched-subunit amino acid transport protein